MNAEHLSILQRGASAWNEWRAANPTIDPDLKDASLRGADLRQANLRQVNLCRADTSGADLEHATLYRANLFRAQLIGCKLNGAGLGRTILSEADLTDAQIVRGDLIEADLRRANMTRACLRGANLRGAALLDTDLTDADISGAMVHGVSAWRVKAQGLKQSDLVITAPKEPTVTVDDIEVAQFIYLLLENSRIRSLIDAVTSKVVLLLGRFNDEGRHRLEILRREFSARGLCTVVFDFQKPSTKDLTSTIEILARLARFVVADVTEPASVPHELATVVPFLRQTPVIPLHRKDEPAYAMLGDFVQSYPWVLEPLEYADDASLAAAAAQITSRAERILRELRKAT